MAMQVGTATDYLDLFRKIYAFLTDNVNGAGWEPLPGGHPHAYTEGIRAITASGWSADTVWDLFNPQHGGYFNFYTNYWMAFEFFEHKTIGSIRLTMPDITGGGPINESPHDILLEKSDDGITWTSAAEWLDQPIWNDDESRTLVCPAPFSTRFLRLKIPASNNSSYSRLYKLRMFDDLGDEHYVNIGGDRQCFRAIVKSPHVIDGVSFHVTMTGYCEPTVPYFSIGFSGASLVEAYDMPITDVPTFIWHYGSSHSFFHVWDAEMPFRFYGDNLSVALTIGVGSTDRVVGFGHLLAYGTPQQYPLPVYIGAEYYTYNVSYEYDSGGDIRSFTCPGNGSLWVFLPDLTWGECQNFKTSSGQDVLSPNYLSLWPGNNARFTELRNAPGDDDSNGSHILYPLIVASYETGKSSMYGEIPNVYAVPALGLSSGDTITVDGQVHRVFRNIWRQSSYDFCAIKEV